MTLLWCILGIIILAVWIIDGWFTLNRPDPPDKGMSALVYRIRVFWVVAIILAMMVIR